MITRFRVKNYKSLVDVDIPLTPIHVIIGQNDTGKTSLLEAILAYCRSADASYTLADSFEGNWQAIELVTHPEAPLISLEADLEGKILFASKRPQAEIQRNTYGFNVEFMSQDRSCLLYNEWSSSGPITEVDRGVRTKVSARVNPGINSESKRKELFAIAELIGSAAMYRLDPRLMKMPAAFDEKRRYRMDPDGFGLSTLLDDILGDDPESFLRLSKTFCGYFPQFKNIRLQTEKAMSRQTDASGVPSSSPSTGKGIYFEHTSGFFMRAQQASDGAVLFLGFLALTAVGKPPSVLLIEEPETGVYPKRLGEIIHILKQLTIKNGDLPVPQIIFTTHSPYVLSYFSPEEVTLMSRVGNTVIARPLRDAPNIYERLGGGAFYLGEVWYNIPEEELFQDA
jgi:predicted ATPase